MNYKDYYELLLTISPDLRLAFELKEMFREFNRTSIEFDAEEKMESLIEMFEEADLYCYKEFASLLKNWRTEIINSFARPYGNTNQSN